MVMCCIQKRFNLERVAALLEDKKIQEENAEAHAKLQDETADELRSKLKKVEHALQQTTKDFIMGMYLLVVVT